MINHENLDILKVEPTGFPEGTNMSKWGKKKKRINAIFNLKEWKNSIAIYWDGEEQGEKKFIKETWGGKEETLITIYKKD